MIKFIAKLLLITFTTICIYQPLPSLCASTTGSIKVFSEIKGVQIFVDEKSYGIDTIMIKDLEPGQHYVKAIYNGAIIYSELITVSAGASSAVLIKSGGQAQEKILESLSKEQQQYKQGKIDILLSKSYQTVGTSNTTSTYFPGYYYYYWLFLL